MSSRGLIWHETAKFDVIVLDVMMPKLGGYSLAEILRAEKIFSLS
jgi:CheY-like chemotaxis protein